MNVCFGRHETLKMRVATVIALLLVASGLSGSAVAGAVTAPARAGQLRLAPEDAGGPTLTISPNPMTLTGVGTPDGTWIYSNVTLTGSGFVLNPNTGQQFVTLEVCKSAVVNYKCFLLSPPVTPGAKNPPNHSIDFTNDPGGAFSVQASIWGWRDSAGNTFSDGFCTPDIADDCYLAVAANGPDGEVDSTFPVGVGPMPPTEADLALTVTRNVPDVLNGQVARYTIALQNLGPDEATGVVVTGTLAQYLTMYTRATIGKSQCTVGSTFVCTLATMAVGPSTPITFRAVGIGNHQGSAQGDISVNVSSTSTDPVNSNNGVDPSITAESPIVSTDLPSDPAFPYSTGDNSGVMTRPSPPGASGASGATATGAVVPALHNRLPKDCPAGLTNVAIGKGSYQGCDRTICGPTGTGDGSGGVRVDAWESGHSGINAFRVTYALWDDQNGWEDSGLTHWVDSSVVVPNDNGTHWYVAYHQFDFTTADTGDAFRVAYDIEWLHKGAVTTQTLATSGWRWDVNATCIAS